MIEGDLTNNVPTVVVGIDGSEAGTDALRWALAEARLRRTPLRVVHAWTYYLNGSFGYMGGAYPTGGLDFGELRDAAEDLVQQTLRDLGEATSGVEVQRQIIQGGAAASLISAVDPGDLLVVGSRGHGGFAGLLLGSVSQQCVNHAPCPVVVVHPQNSQSRRALPTEAGVVAVAISAVGN